MSTQADALEQFARCVYEPADIIEVRLIKSGSPVLQKWTTVAELPSKVAALEAHNAAGRNVYIGANPRKAHGGGFASDVLLARCLFADFDGGTTPVEALERCKTAGLPKPTVIVTSGHGTHCWWLLDEPITDLAEWSKLQKRLALALGSDATIHDPPRIMRVPGFLNVKRQPYVPAELVFADRERQFWSGAFKCALPELPPEPRPASPPEFVTTGTVGDVTRRALAYIAKMPPAIEGQHGHTATYKVACALIGGFGLSSDDAWPILWDYSQRCDPPWNEKELRHKLSEAEKNCATRGKLLHRPNQRIEQRCTRKPLLA